MKRATVSGLELRNPQEGKTRNGNTTVERTLLEVAPPIGTIRGLSGRGHYDGTTYIEITCERQGVGIMASLEMLSDAVRLMEDFV